MNLIYKYSIYEDLFIIDYEGKYFAKMINEFDKNYENKYLNKERFSSNYSNSLVKMNFINTYFSMNRETFEK
jgi:GTP-sensing pleiotropic transcriptional regulator CodY